MPYVVGSLGSRPTTSKSMGRGKAADVGGREPKGKRHAVDVSTGMAACGTRDALRVFDDLPWAAEGQWCTSCESIVPFE